MLDFKYWGIFLICSDLRQIFQDQWLWIYIVRYVFRVVDYSIILYCTVVYYSQPHYPKIYNTILKKRRCGDSTYYCVVSPLRIWRKCHTTFSNGCLGSHNDEERSEMRYVMRSAYFRESSNLWTHIALPVTTGSMLIWVSANPPILNKYMYVC